MKILLTSIIIFTNLFSLDLIKPIEENIQMDLNKALLGKRLFFEKRLSKDNTVSCASCHDILSGGDDNLKVSKGILGKKGTLNAPTVLNARYNFVQFWDGRARDLKEQAVGPIHNPIEMGSNIDEVVGKLKKDESYVLRFKEVYNDIIRASYIIDSIVEFEKALVTPNSKFDQYLKGDKNALSKEQLQGYELFKSYGCISCHNGINIGGNLFQKMGILKEPDYPKGKYLGRYNVTKDEEDKYFFKVPTLRNIAQTAPYLHNGSVKTLRDTIKIMMEYQLGVRPKEQNIDKIIAFLNALNGQTPKIMEMNE